MFCVCTAATNLCFGERNVYTSEVLAVVMQQLMEQSPLPMLLMRTVIQSLTMYPRLGGFVMNILSRLIVKQVSTKLQTNIHGFSRHWQVHTVFWKILNFKYLPIWPYRFGSILKCGRDSWSAVRGRSLSRTASSCSCRPLSWPACLNAAQRWESLFCSTSTRSHLIRWGLLTRSINLIYSPLFWFHDVPTVSIFLCNSKLTSRPPSCWSWRERKNQNRNPWSRSWRKR